MVGPFMQGVLLMGIIYFYSKGMMSMINDYYRSEFQRKLQAETGDPAAQQTPLSLDNFMDYVREMDIDVDETNFRILPSWQQTTAVCCAGSWLLWQFMQLTGAWSAEGICPVLRCAS